MAPPRRRGIHAGGVGHIHAQLEIVHDQRLPRVKVELPDRLVDGVRVRLVLIGLG